MPRRPHLKGPVGDTDVKDQTKKPHTSTPGTDHVKGDRGAALASNGSKSSARVRWAKVLRCLVVWCLVVFTVAACFGIGCFQLGEHPKPKATSHGVHGSGGQPSAKNTSASPTPDSVGIVTPNKLFSNSPHWVLAGGAMISPLERTSSHGSSTNLPSKVRVFTDFDDTLYSSLRKRHFSFAAGTDTRQGDNLTHGRLYAGVAWLYYAISYAHGGPAKSLWDLFRAVTDLGVDEELAAASKQLLEILGGPSGPSLVHGRMDVVVVTARPVQKDTRGGDAKDARAACFVDEARQFGGSKMHHDHRVIEYFREVASLAGRDEGWGFAVSHGYTYLTTFLPGLVWNVLGGVSNFATTLQTDSHVNGTPSSFSDKRATYQIVGQHKAKFIDTWARGHPDEGFVWFGDNGQGDLCTGAILLKSFNHERLRGVFIHDVSRVATHGNDSMWAGHRGELGIMPDALDVFDCGLNTSEFVALLGSRAFFFDNFFDAAVIANQLGIIDKEAMKFVRDGFNADRNKGLCCKDDPATV